MIAEKLSFNDHAPKVKLFEAKHHISPCRKEIMSRKDVSYYILPEEYSECTGMPVDSNMLVAGYYSN